MPVEQPTRPRGKPIEFSALEQRALEEAAKTGYTAAAEIVGPDFTGWTPEQFGMAMQILEGRIALLEQRFHWYLSQNAPAFIKALGLKEGEF
jgi:hypothetical protein